MEIITFEAEDMYGKRRTIEIPEGINLSLMEALKASDYEIQATCGGMALCATCHIEVASGSENLDEAQDAEIDMLDTLPDATSDSRLACQIKVTSSLNGAIIKIKYA